MRVLQATKEAFKNVTRSKLRTLLTMLGLIVGISSVIALVGLGEGSNKEVEEQMQALGGDILTAYLFDASLTYEDVVKLRNNASLENVAPSQSLSGKVSYGKKTSNRGMIEASDENYLGARDLDLAAGRNLTSVDRENKSKVCILGSAVVKDLFGSSDAVGKTIKIDGENYTVVGVLAAQGEMVGMFTEGMVLVPYTLVSEFGSKEEIGTLYAKAVSQEDVPWAKSEITRFLTDEKQISEGKFSVNSQDEMLGAEGEINATMTILMSGIASISLIVAGIGVMNVMLVSVTERVREIGIKKALGARRLDILFQFLFEALIISFVGGACGVLAGILFGIFADNMGLRFEVSGDMVIIAVAASATIGLLFGIFPAYRASRLNPIEALRQE